MIIREKFFLSPRILFSDVKKLLVIQERDFVGHLPEEYFFYNSISINIL